MTVADSRVPGRSAGALGTPRTQSARCGSPLLGCGLKSKSEEKEGGTQTREQRSPPSCTGRARMRRQKDLVAGQVDLSMSFAEGDSYQPPTTDQEPPTTDHLPPATQYLTHMHII